MSSSTYSRRRFNCGPVAELDAAVEAEDSAGSSGTVSSLTFVSALDTASSLNRRGLEPFFEHGDTSLLAADALPSAASIVNCAQNVFGIWLRLSYG